MSVLIKGMEMPTNCYNCPFLDYEEGFCFASGVKHESGWYEYTLCPGEIKDKRHKYCPLVPVPPHGRLIDADELLMHRFVGVVGEAEKSSYMVGWNSAIEAVVENAHTVIPAEEGE